jgi:hypothetical protein
MPVCISILFETVIHNYEYVWNKSLHMCLLNYQISNCNKPIVMMFLFRSVMSHIHIPFYRIGGVMVSVLASSAVYSGFERRSGQTKDYKIGMCCISANHASLRRKKKDWLARIQNNVPEWNDMSTRELLFQWDNTIKILFTSLKINLFLPWYSWTIAELTLNSNRSLTHSLISALQYAV